MKNKHLAALVSAMIIGTNSLSTLQWSANAADDTTQPSDTAAVSADVKQARLGDVNANGSVSVADAILLARIVGEDTTVQIPVGAVLDINADSVVNYEDVSAILQCIKPYCLAMKDVEAKAGEIVSIPICVYGDEGTAAGEIYFNYDKYLTPVAVRAGEAYKDLILEAHLDTYPTYVGWVTKNGAAQTAEDGAAVVYVDFKVADYLSAPQSLAVWIVEQADSKHYTALYNDNALEVEAGFGHCVINAQPNSASTSPTTAPVSFETTTTTNTTATFDENNLRASGSCGEEVEWLLSKDGTLLIRGQGEMATYGSSKEIPWDAYRSTIRSIQIADGVLAISDGLFAELPNLKTVDMADSVLFMGNSAFMNCPSLESLSLSADLTTIGENAFSNCTKLKSLTIPIMITALNVDFIMTCPSLETITFMNPSCDVQLRVPLYHTTFISEADSKIQEFCLMNKLRFTATDEFVKLGVLEKEHLYYKLENQKATILSVYSEDIAEQLNLEVPSEIEGCPVTALAEDAFSGYKNINQVIGVQLPDTLETIGARAFQECRITSIVIPEGVKVLPQECFIGSVVSMVTLPDSMTEIQQAAFYGCQELQTIYLPENLLTIGNDAFASCHALRVVEFPEKLHSIGSHAFDGAGLQTVDLPASVAVLGDSVFSACGEMTDLFIRNPKCSLVFNETFCYDTTVIHCFEGSTAMKYALQFNRSFFFIE